MRALKLNVWAYKNYLSAFGALSTRGFWSFTLHQAPVVQRLDNAIRRINHYPVINVNKTNHAIRWIVIYPVDSVIQPLNNPGQHLNKVKPL